MSLTHTHSHTVSHTNMLCVVPLSHVNRCDDGGRTELNVVSVCVISKLPFSECVCVLYKHVLPREDKFSPLWF